MRLLHRIRLFEGGPVEPPDDAITVYWTTDSHLYSPLDGGPGEDPNGPNAEVGTRHFWKAPARLRQFVQAVNAAPQCDLVAHTGDMLQRGTDWGYFTQWWDDINLPVPQVLTPGNHDFAGSDYETVVAGLGLDGQPEIAGSKLNHSFRVERGDHAYRMIVADTNYLEDYSHGSITAMRFHPDGLDWIASELASCPEDDVIIWTHGAIHEFLGHFYEPSAQSFRSVVEAAQAARPALRVSCLFGHYHRTTMRVWESLGPRLPGYSSPAMCEDFTERYCVVRAWTGQVLVEEHGW